MILCCPGRALLHREAECQGAAVPHHASQAALPPTGWPALTTLGAKDSFSTDSGKAKYTLGVTCLANAPFDTLYGGTKWAHPDG